MIELKNVTKFYNSNGVVTLGLRNINLKLNKGEIVAITGDSGSGKSTLLNVITGVDTYEEGEILFYGNETSYFDQEDMDSFRKNNVSFIYQKYNIIDSYTVLENVMIPLTLRGMDKDEASLKASEIIERVGLKDRINNKGSKLSGGEKQRCVIARALAEDSPILACDEPTGNLDSKTGEEIIKLIKEVSDDKLVLIVTHNYDQVKDIVTRKIKISDGEIIEDVTISKAADEGFMPMSLDTGGMKRKDTLQFAIKNIKATPKKTCLVSLVLLFVATMAMIMTLFSFEFASKGEKANSYNVINSNNVIVYNSDLKSLDITNLNYENMSINPFFENREHNIKLNGTIEGLYLTEVDMNRKLIYGSAPANDNELAYIYPKGTPIANKEEYYNKEASYLFESMSSYISFGKITGIYYSNEVTYPTIKPYRSFSDEMKLNLNIDLLKLTANDFFDIKLMGINEDLASKTTLLLPESFELTGFKCTILDAYPVELDYIVSYDSSINRPTLLLANPKSANFKLDIKPYMISLMAKNPHSIKDELINNGFDVTLPASDYSTSSINKVLRNTLLVMTILSIVAMYFVSYAIISRVYQSRIKDYGTLRALGVIKEDLGRMTRIELGLMSVASSILGILLAYLIGLIFKLSYINYISLAPIAFYLVVMLVFGILIAHKFNRRVFRETINNTLRDGD